MLLYYGQKYNYESLFWVCDVFSLLLSYKAKSDSSDRTLLLETFSAHPSNKKMTITNCQQSQKSILRDTNFKA